MRPLFGFVRCKTTKISLNASVNNLGLPICLWMICSTTFQQSSLQAEKLGPEKAHKHLVTIEWGTPCKWNTSLVKTRATECVENGCLRAIK